MTVSINNDPGLYLITDQGSCHGSQLHHATQSHHNCGACSKPDSESKALGARIERRKSYLPGHVVDFPLPPVGNIDVEPAKSL